VKLPPGGEKIGLPVRVFLYTLDQLSVLLDVQEKTIKTKYVFFEGRSVGSRSKHLLLARNIAPPEETPDWRVAERELIRWLKVKGFRYYEAGAVSN